MGKIKHFFSVPGIVFVLSIDKSQLANSVRGFYGSEAINADEYLRRFIDIEYRLPEPNIETFCDYLYGYFSFNDFFDNTKPLHHARQFVDSFVMISITFQLSLRQIEKLFAHSRISLKTFAGLEYLAPHLFFILVFMRVYKPDIYNKIKSKEYVDPQTIIDDMFFLNSALPKNYNVGYVFIELLVLYDKYYRDLTAHDSLLSDATTSKYKFTINNMSPESIGTSINRCIEAYQDSNMIKHLTGKIELYSRIV